MYYELVITLIRPPKIKGKTNSLTKSSFAALYFTPNPLTESAT
jgi:hypothetical protein